MARNVGNLSSTDTNSMTVGEYMRLLRQNAGLTQTELADKAGISPAMVSRVEKGQRLYRHNTLTTVLGIINNHTK